MVSSHRFTIGILYSFMAITLGWSCPAFAADWNAAASRDVALFFPGSASWEKILINETHEGSTKVRKRFTCLSCHEGEEPDMGKTIAGDSEHPFHREASGPTSLNAKLKIAIENDEILFRVTLPQAPVSLLSLLLDDNSYSHTELSGCWSSCHDDNRNMDSAGSLDLTKYLPVSRTKNTRTGGGESYKSPGELKELLANGQYLELIGASIANGTAQGLHGYVLDARHMQEQGPVSAELSVDGTAKVITIRRALNPNTGTSKVIKADGSYTMSLAIHLNEVKGANHLVSMPVNFVVDQGNTIRFLAESE